HLRSLGHERIGLLLGPRDHVPSQRKLEAARRLAESWGAPLDESLVVHSLYSLEAGQAAATRLLSAGVSAILCASDPMALGAIRAARRAG
ncbi:substrate-binding domain-containing protein, partial [Bacillus sp. SIMBA_069]